MDEGRTVVGPPAPIREAIRHDLAAIRARWGWVVALGLATVAMGALLIGAPVMTTLATMTVLSVLLILAGVGQLIGAFWSRTTSGFLVHLLTGLLYLILGVVTINRPLVLSEILTLLIGSVLIVGGAFRIAAAATVRFEGWAWSALGGAIGLLLGLMIWMQWPVSSLWVIGVFLGIDVLFIGLTWVITGLAIRRLPSPRSPAGRAPA